MNATNLNLSAIQISDVDSKLSRVSFECHEILSGSAAIIDTSTAPARSLPIVSSQQMPTRDGLQSAAGQARLLHDLANIELQAMELGLRTLYDFADVPADFKAGIVEIILEEARHLKMCLAGIRELGFDWGAWPAHNTLWSATSKDDSLLDRILIVNCYLEASGLDSGEMILKKLSGVSNRLPREIVSVIAREEIGHVRFGLEWYREFCRKENRDSSNDFSVRLENLFERVPARAAQVNESVRREAGFLPQEIAAVRDFNARKQSSAKSKLQRENID